MTFFTILRMFIVVFLLFGFEDLVESVIFVSLIKFNDCGHALLIEAAMQSQITLRHAAFMNHYVLFLQSVEHRQPCCSHASHENVIRSHFIVSYIAHWVVQ